MKEKRKADEKRIIAKAALLSQKRGILWPDSPSRTAFPSFPPVIVLRVEDAPKELKQKAVVSKKDKAQEVDDALVEEAFSSILGRKPKQAAVQVIEPKGSGTRDEEYYIHYRQGNENTEKGYSMSGGTFFEQARSAEVDFTGDDNDTMKRQKNTLIWDRKKKRFVNSNNATKDVSGQVVRTESGKKINSSYKTKA